MSEKSIYVDSGDGTKTNLPETYSSFTEDDIQKHIYTIRGHQVMLDSDLALLYGVETRVINQSVKRNIERFPEDFMFHLAADELATLKSQL